jgi:23S rRNA pseudouridine1911/1915/1917 synthase
LDQQKLKVSPCSQGQRLDLFIQQNLPDCSRAGIQRLIKKGNIRVNQKIVKKGAYKVRQGDEVHVFMPQAAPPELTPWHYPLDILYEDSSLLVINKPAGMVVHPSAGHRDQTLVHALLARGIGLSQVGGILRPGIIHRLDKDTSGALMVAKTDSAHWELARQFKRGGIEKIYLALVKGPMPGKCGTITAPIGRHPVNRKKMSTLSPSGKPATTLWRVEREFTGGICLLRVELKTGRTHQIRVHLAREGRPVLGDSVYGGRNASPRSLMEQDLRQVVRRQMLHAYSIGFMHPETGQWVRLEAPLPQDMVEVLSVLTKKTEKVVKES